MTGDEQKAEVSAVLSALADGLPLVPRPYGAIAKRLGICEAGVLEEVERLQRDGVISRFGVVVRHHELGYRANAMVVWDIPDNLVAEVGRTLTEQPGVTLCYQRPRRLPRWPYNLFCMFHGKCREAVSAEVEAASLAAGLSYFPREILFSKRRFKQRGATYKGTPS